jgi:hypothetical protein
VRHGAVAARGLQQLEWQDEAAREVREHGERRLHGAARRRQAVDGGAQQSVDDNERHGRASPQCARQQDRELPPRAVAERLGHHRPGSHQRAQHRGDGRAVCRNTHVCARL